MTSNIAAFQEISFLDYPNIPASIIFLAGCNMECPYCHNKILNSRTRPLITYNIADIIKKLEEHFTKGWIKGLVITGGEPCLNENEILRLLDGIRNNTKLWWNFKVKLDTNGSKPSVLKQLKNCVDYIAMDIKRPFPKNNCAISESVDIIMGSQIDYEFRTTVFPPWVDREKIKKIGGNIKGAKIHYIQQYKKVEETENIEPYQPLDLIRFKDIMLNYVNKCEIRGI